ncbi:MAG: hypothetical protein CR972_01055 [Candidatus Moraniibacteriota bacterium]|nr:MAG: hypothetical protein CR972_01055 [Candidatus Moranbacteria bacterium]
MKNISLFTRTITSCFVFVFFAMVQNTFAAPASGAHLYYIKASALSGGTYENELYMVDVNDVSNGEKIGKIGLNDNQAALSATVDPETGEVYFIGASFTEEGDYSSSDLMILDMDTLGVEKVGELSRYVEDSSFEVLMAIRFDDKGQLYGAGWDVTEGVYKLNFYRIDKKTGQKESLATYEDFESGLYIPFTFNEDDGLFYIISTDTGDVFAIDPNNPGDLQEVSSFGGEIFDPDLFSFIHRSGANFYALFADETYNYLVKLGFSDVNVSEVLLGTLDHAGGFPLSIFFWPVELIEDDSDYKDCKKDHGNSAYKKAYQQVKYYKNHDRDLYLSLQSVYRTYRTSGDTVRDALKLEDWGTYEKYREYRRYKKYKECKELK